MLASKKNKGQLLLELMAEEEFVKQTAIQKELRALNPFESVSLAELQLLK